MSEKKMLSKAIKTGYIVLFVGVLGAGGARITFGAQKTFSENENRVLTKMPKATWTDIKKGEFQKKLENATCDQFPMRDRWLEVATCADKAMGQSCINGVYLGKQGYLLEQVLDSDLSQKTYKNNLQMIKMMAEDINVDYQVMMIPSPATVMKCMLPNNAVMYDAESMEQTGKDLFKEHWLDVTSPLQQKAKDTQVYFKTDHHWNLYGAYEGYTTFAKANEIETKSMTSFDVRIASEDFLGTMYSKVLTANPSKDKLCLIENLPENLSVKRDGKDCELYDLEKLQKKDKYAVYFGGNYGLVEMDNPDGAKDETLIVIKDSFANSMVPFLLNDYKRVVMIDLRYYTSSVKEFIKSQNHPSVLVLYEMSNFAKDDHMYKLLR